MTYYWLTSSEDGVHIKTLKGSEDVLKEIEERTEDGWAPIFLKQIPEQDKGCWYADEHSVVLIKGEIIVPKPKNVVKSYDVE